MLSDVNRTDLGTHDHTSGLRQCKCSCRGLGRRTRLEHTEWSSPRQSLHLSPSEDSAVNGGNEFESYYWWACQHSRLQSLFKHFGNQWLKKEKKNFWFSRFMPIFFPLSGLLSWNQSKQYKWCKKIRISLAETNLLYIRRFVSFMYVWGTVSDAARRGQYAHKERTTGGGFKQCGRYSKDRCLVSLEVNVWFISFIYGMV